MVHIDLMFPSKFLKSADLRGKDVTLTIYKVILEPVRGMNGSEDLWNVYFDECRAAAVKAGKPDMEKRLICKKVHARQIAKATNEPDGAKWVGKRITLFTDKWRGDDCIRVRETAPAANTPAAPASVTEPEPANA